ncbi:MAG: endospore germination permease [Firmicutes bacterium]|nr:endospore germination permease [Bacillota bacterium]
MTDGRNHGSLAPEAIFALLFLALSGMEFLAAPYGAVRILGPSSYWAVVVGMILAMPVLVLARAWRRRFPGKNLRAVATAALGRPLGVIGNLLFLAVYLIWLVVAVRDAGDLVLAYLLDRTPLWVVVGFFLLGMLYVVANGLSTIFRLAEFVLIPALALRLLMSLVSLQGMEISHLFPAFSAPLLAYLRAGLDLFRTFLPLAALFLLGDLLPGPEGLFRNASLATGSATAILFLDALGAVGVFGADLAGELAWPGLAAIHHVSFPYLLVEQLGLLFLIVWLVTFFVAASFYLHLVAAGLTDAFPRLPYSWTTVGLALLVAFGGLILPNAAVVRTIFDGLRRFAMLPAAGYPFLVYFVAVLRGLGGRKDAA